MFLELIKFLFYSALIVITSKYILVTTLRKLAENLNLKAKTIGDVAGYATSMPEFLTIITSSVKGLSSASVYNILSSNIINLVQYIFAIILNKNGYKLKNAAIQADLIMVSITILIPIFLLIFNIEMKLSIVPFFIILYMLFIHLNANAHKLYLRKEDEKLSQEIEEERRQENNNKMKILKYILYLLLTGVLLFFIGDKLGNTLDSLCKAFNVSQKIIGILLGFVTSLPELITFFESQRHHKKSDNDMLGVVEATNNLLTSNILNLFVIQSVGILILAIL